MHRWIGAAVCAIWGLAPVAGRAELTICNQTAVPQSIAVGYQSDGVWFSEGWWNLDPGECASPIEGALTSRYYYYRAEADGRDFADEDFAFCTRPEAFTIRGDGDCAARGHDTSLFRKIDTGETARSFTLTMADAAPEAEPYAAAAVFQECGTGDGGAYCAFHADGAKVFVYDDGRTPGAVLDRLRRLAPGTPIGVAGNLVEVFDTTAQVTLRTAGLRGATTADDLLAHMQGQWYAVDDPDAQFTVLGAERHETHGGQDTGLSWLSIADTCDGFDAAPPYLVAREPETGENSCYGIDTLDAWAMRLIYLPRGNILSYRKLD